MKIIRLRRESDLIRKESGRVFNFNIYYNHYELAKCPRCEERYLVLINYKWAGRGMRNGDDWCRTYVWDKLALDLLTRNPSLFPMWFREAVEIQ